MSDAPNSEAVDRPKGAEILLALHFPSCDGDEDADIVASEIAEIVNEEHRRNNGGKRLPFEQRVSVCLFPSPHFVTTAQVQWLLRATEENEALKAEIATLTAQLARYERAAQSHFELMRVVEAAKRMDAAYEPISGIDAVLDQWTEFHLAADNLHTACAALAAVQVSEPEGGC